MVINTCQILPFFKISRTHACKMTHFLDFANSRLPLKKCPFFTTMGTSVVYILVGSGGVCVFLCVDVGDASVFLVPSLCLVWPTNSVHWAITVATIILCLHSTTTATFEPPGWQWFCPHSTSFAWPAVPPQQLWSFKEGTRVVLHQLHRNRTFWVWATTEHRNHFSGRSKVARRSQPCVKGAWVSLCIMHSWRHRWRHEVTK